MVRKMCLRHNGRSDRHVCEHDLKAGISSWKVSIISPMTSRGASQKDAIWWQDQGTNVKSSCSPRTRHVTRSMLSTMNVWNSQIRMSIWLSSHGPRIWILARHPSIRTSYTNLLSPLLFPQSISIFFCFWNFPNLRGILLLIYFWNGNGTSYILNHILYFLIV